MLGDDENLELQIKRSVDFIWLAICGIGVVLLTWGGFWGFRDLTAQDFDGVDFEVIFVMLLSVIAPEGFQMVALICAGGFGAIAIGAAWRLRDQSPAIIARREGIIAHASLHRNPICWSDVERISIKRGRSSQICIRLMSRFWALDSPWTSRQLLIPVIATNWSHREAHKYLAKMRKWKRLAAKR